MVVGDLQLGDKKVTLNHLDIKHSLATVAYWVDLVHFFAKKNDTKCFRFVYHISLARPICWTNLHHILFEHVKDQPLPFFLKKHIMKQQIFYP